MYDDFRSRLAAVRTPKPGRYEKTSTTPYMLGRRAWTQCVPPVPPVNYSAEQAREFRRGYDDGRRWALRRMLVNVQTR
jgi:hypothetical protein